MLIFEFLQYLELYETYFTKCSQAAEIVIAEPLDYSRQSIQHILLDFAAKLENTEHTFNTDFWLRDYLAFLNFQTGAINRTTVFCRIFRTLKKIFFNLC